METINTIPSWLMVDQADQLLARHPKVLKELTDQIYEIAFEQALVKLVSGRTLDSIIGEYHTPIEIDRFRSWIYKDPIRKQRYNNAMEIGTEALEDEILRIADGTTGDPEDVQRSTLKIGTRKWLMGVRNRRKYGDVKQLDVNNTTTVNIKNLLEQREAQLMNVIDGEVLVERIEGPVDGDD